MRFLDQFLILHKKKLACSKVAAEWLFGKHNGKNVEVIKNGIDVNRFAFSEVKREYMRKNMGYQINL